MSIKLAPQNGANDANFLTDRWEPETNEVTKMFTFDPHAPENEESLSRASCARSAT
jgi:hypothetical protein